MVIVDFQNFIIFIILCFFSLLCYSLFFKKPNNSRSDFPLPPSPPSLPFIGHLHLLLSVLIHRSLQKLSSKYGSFLYLRIFTLPIVLVSSSSFAYEIFRTHDVNISSRGFPPTDDSLFVGSFSFISAPYGDYYKFMKKLLVTNLLGPQALERSRRARADVLAGFYKNMFDKAMKKESVEICEETLKLTLNSICKMMMGRSCSQENNGEMERVMRLATELDSLTKKILLANMLTPRLNKFVLSLFRKEMTSVSSRFNELLERILEEHEKGHRGMDLMDALLEAYRDENAEYKITRNHIKSFFADLLFAGIGTSMQTTQWIMAEIINNPDILERMRGEIDSVVGRTRLVQETDLPNLPYLQAVVKEGIRFHPPGPIFGRFSKERCRIGGFYVPENTLFMVNAYAVMRDPCVWEDPDEFKPERFLGFEQHKGTREESLKYIAFGSGRRSCPGENLAYIFIGTAIGVMVQGFEWRIGDDKVNMEEAVVGLTVTMAHPLKLTPVARTIKPLSLNLQKQDLMK